MTLADRRLTLAAGASASFATQRPTRLARAVVMVVGVALIAIATASITSTVVEAAQRKRRADRETRGWDVQQS
jgi:hypothetical protein